MREEDIGSFFSARSENQFNFQGIRLDLQCSVCVCVCEAFLLFMASTEVCVVKTEAAL